jgi:hypothetical protein
LLNGYLNTSDLIKLIRDHVKYERTAKDINTTTSKD